MASIAVSVIKVIAGVIVTQLVVLALFTAVGLGASRYVSGQCVADPAASCALAASVRTWWFVAWMLAMMPILLLSLVLFVWRWSAPGTRGRVAGAIGILWGGVILVHRFVFGGGIHANPDAQFGADVAVVFGAVMMLVGVWFFFRKRGPSVAPPHSPAPPA